jgi:hypothetical protein
MHQNYDDEDGPIYSLMLSPCYEDGAMHVKVGMMLPNEGDENEDAIMVNALTLLYAAFDLMNTDTDFLNIVKAKQEQLMETDFIATDATVEETAAKPVEYLDESRKIIKLDFTSTTKGRA